MNMFRICCGKPKRDKAKTEGVYRRPTEDERLSGVPEWFSVLEDSHSVNFISPDGRIFDTVGALKKWRETHVCMDDRPYFLTLG